jgi:hypothetical protein
MVSAFATGAGTIHPIHHFIRLPRRIEAYGNPGFSRNA